MISLLRFKLDDPLDAVAVHGGGGLWGLVCVPFFMSAGLPEGERGILFDGEVPASHSSPSSLPFLLSSYPFCPQGT